MTKAKNGLPLLGNHQNIQSFAYQDELGLALIDIVKVIPNGVLCFFPSYSTLNSLLYRWRKTGVYSSLSSIKTIFEGIFFKFIFLLIYFYFYLYF